MSKKEYMPADDQGKAALLEGFRDRIGTFAAALGVTPAEVASQAADATWFRYILGHSATMRDSASQWTNYKNLVLNGSGSAVVPITPAAPVPVPPSVPPGVITRFRDLASRIKTHANYLDSTGEALGIIGAEGTRHDLATHAPVISLRLNGGQIEIIWNKGGMESVEIQVDRGDGKWAFLAIDTHPNYTDTTPLPATPAKWKFRASYCEDAHKIGQWSNVAEITVGG